MTGVGALDRIHGERADGIGKFAASWHVRRESFSRMLDAAATGASRVEKGARIFHYPGGGSNHECF
jgi:hypothetical protein